MGQQLHALQQLNRADRHCAAWKEMLNVDTTQYNHIFYLPSCAYVGGFFSDMNPSRPPNLLSISFSAFEKRWKHLQKLPSANISHLEHQICRSVMHVMCHAKVTVCQFCGVSFRSTRCLWRWPEPLWTLSGQSRAKTKIEEKSKKTGWKWESVGKCWMMQSAVDIFWKLFVSLSVSYQLGMVRIEWVGTVQHISIAPVTLERQKRGPQTQRPLKARERFEVYTSMPLRGGQFHSISKTLDKFCEFQNFSQLSKAWTQDEADQLKFKMGST